MHVVDLDFSQLVCFLVQDFCFAWVDFESLRFCTFWTSAIIFWILHMSDAKVELGFCRPRLQCAVVEEEHVGTLPDSNAK